MKISKIIHQIWIGPNERPKELMDSWKEKHKDYEYILWDNEKIKELFPLKNQHLYDLYSKEIGENEKEFFRLEYYKKHGIRLNMFSEYSKYVGQSNLLRYEILLRYGGIYIDADSLCLRKLEGDFLEKDFFAVRVNEKHRGERLNNCFIGCVPNHLLIRKVINELSKKNNLFFPSWKFSGPVFFTKIVRENNFEIEELPSYYFSPVFLKTKKTNRNKEFDYKGNFKPFAEHKWFQTAAKDRHKYCKKVEKRKVNE